MLQPLLFVRTPLRWLLAALACLLAGNSARAQAPAWNAAIIGSLGQLGGITRPLAVAADASGNLLVTGSFFGRVAFGGTVLTGSNSGDVFLAKYVVATSTWAWAVRAGGSGPDAGRGVAVSGSRVYVAGYLTNDLANTNAATFGTGSPQYGTGATSAADAFVACYTDQGATATFNWSQVAGGTGADNAVAVAVSGSSVYVAGFLVNTSADAGAVRFGGSGPVAGTLAQPGASATSSTDLFVAKYQDGGTSAGVAWTQVGGGTGYDAATSLAVSGSSVYVAGALTNSRSDANAVRLGGSGPTPGTVVQLGAGTSSSQDVLLAKYTDQGTTASVTWTQVGGGLGSDAGTAVAVSGSSVYVAGTFFDNRAGANAVRFGGSGTAAGTAVQVGATPTLSRDVVLAKYTDNGTTASLGWTQVAGGTDNDLARGLAAGSGGVYLTGTLGNDLADNSTVRFGGSGTVAGTVPLAGASAFNSNDLFVARYADQGTTAAVSWVRLAGGDGDDNGEAIALSGTALHVAGRLGYGPLVSFGTAAGSPVRAIVGDRTVLGQLDPATGTWVAVGATDNGGNTFATATATDPQGNVYLGGYFEGVVTFGSTTLTSLGGADWFVAKYVPASGTWAWATSGGGSGDDYLHGLAVQGASVYAAGSMFNDSRNSSGVQLGGTGLAGALVPANGASPIVSDDQLLAKYQDNGSSGSLGWVQVAGGTGYDGGWGVAVSGPSVYVTGSLQNSAANDLGVVFGGNGTAVGTVGQPGASPTNVGDLYLAKYVDNGSSGSLGWVQVAGGNREDGGYAVAVSGSSVYVAGMLHNSTTNTNAVVFGGSGPVAGTRPQHGATAAAGYDLLLAKYQDDGSSGSPVWTQVGGGTSTDYATGVAVSGTSVYVTGSLLNTRANLYAVVFGGGGTVAGTAPQYGATATAGGDLVLAKYTDQGSTAAFGWSQVAGGTAEDYGNAVAVSGSSVYVAGVLNNTTANATGAVFGGSGTAPGTVSQPGASASGPTNVLVAKYTDQGATGAYAWSQVAGGNNIDEAAGVALSGQQVYVAGYVAPPATFGPVAVAGPTAAYVAVLGNLLDPTLTPLPTRPAGAGPALALYPNPSGGAATLTGAAPGAVVQVLDALGRVAATATADAAGAARLAGLAPGLYLVRAGAGSARLAVE